MKKIILFLLLIFAFNLKAQADTFEYAYNKSGFKYVKHAHYEDSYVQAWCSANGGKAEVENPDGTRVDCVTKTHAIEFDFANTWAEGIGQALHYGAQTGKRPMVMLIIEKPQQMIYFERVKKDGEIYGFDAEYVTPEILNLKDDECENPNCKCHKKKKNYKN